MKNVTKLNLKTRILSLFAVILNYHSIGMENLKEEFTEIEQKAEGGIQNTIGKNGAYTLGTLVVGTATGMGVRYYDKSNEKKKDEEITQLKADMITLKDQYTVLATKEAKEKQEITEKNAILKKLEAEIAESEKSCKITESEVAKVLQECEVIKEQIADTQPNDSKLQGLKNTLTAKVQEYDALVAKLDQHKTTHKELTDEHKKHIPTEAKFQLLEIEVKECQKELKDNETAKEKLQSQIIVLTTENEKLNNIIKQKEDALDESNMFPKASEIIEDFDKIIKDDCSTEDDSDNEIDYYLDYYLDALLHPKTATGAVKKLFSLERISWKILLANIKDQTPKKKNYNNVREFCNALCDYELIENYIQKEQGENDISSNNDGKTNSNHSAEEEDLSNYIPQISSIMKGICKSATAMTTGEESATKSDSSTPGQEGIDLLISQIYKFPTKREEDIKEYLSKHYDKQLKQLNDNDKKKKVREIFQSNDPKDDVEMLKNILTAKVQQAKKEITTQRTTIQNLKKELTAALNVPSSKNKQSNNSNKQQVKKLQDKVKVLESELQTLEKKFSNMRFKENIYLLKKNMYEYDAFIQELKQDDLVINKQDFVQFQKFSGKLLHLISSVTKELEKRNSQSPEKKYDSLLLKLKKKQYMGLSRLLKGAGVNNSTSIKEEELIKELISRSDYFETEMEKIEYVVQFDDTKEILPTAEEPIHHSTSNLGAATDSENENFSFPIKKMVEESDKKKLPLMSYIFTSIRETKDLDSNIKEKINKHILENSRKLIFRELLYSIEDHDDECEKQLIEMFVKLIQDEDRAELIQSNIESIISMITINIWENKNSDVVHRLRRSLNYIFESFYNIGNSLVVSELFYQLSLAIAQTIRDNKKLLNSEENISKFHEVSMLIPVLSNLLTLSNRYYNSSLVRDVQKEIFNKEVLHSHLIKIINELDEFNELTSTGSEGYSLKLQTILKRLNDITQSDRIYIDESILGVLEAITKYITNMLRKKDYVEQERVVIIKVINAFKINIMYLTARLFKNIANCSYDDADFSCLYKMYNGVRVQYENIAKRNMTLQQLKQEYAALQAQIQQTPQPQFTVKPEEESNKKNEMQRIERTMQGKYLEMQRTALRMEIVCKYIEEKVQPIDLYVTFVLSDSGKKVHSDMIDQIIRQMNEQIKNISASEVFDILKLFTNYFENYDETRLQYILSTLQQIAMLSENSQAQKTVSKHKISELEHKISELDGKYKEALVLNIKYNFHDLISPNLLIEGEGSQNRSNGQQHYSSNFPVDSQPPLEQERKLECRDDFVEDYVDEKTRLFIPLFYDHDIAYKLHMEHMKKSLKKVYYIAIDVKRMEQENRDTATVLNTILQEIKSGVLSGEVLDEKQLIYYLDENNYFKKELFNEKLGFKFTLQLCEKEEVQNIKEQIYEVMSRQRKEEEEYKESAGYQEFRIILERVPELSSRKLTINDEINKISDIRNKMLEYQHNLQEEIQRILDDQQNIQKEIQKILGAQGNNQKTAQNEQNSTMLQQTKVQLEQQIKTLQAANVNYEDQIKKKQQKLRECNEDIRANEYAIGRIKQILDGYQNI